MAAPLSLDDAARVETLVRIFTRIGDERMRDLPLYNPALAVEAVGFRPWGGWLAGILVTPWFMNFMLLPGEAALAGRAVGSKMDLDFPRGTVKFTIGEVEEVGAYAASSLYSPMRDFANHELAVTTAWAAVEKFFRPAEEDQPIACTMSPTEGETPNPHG